MRVSRRLIKWTAVPLIVVQAGCATQGARLPEMSAAVAQGTVSEAEWKTCDAYSERKGTKKPVGGMVVLGIFLVPIGVALAIGGPGVALPFEAWGQAIDNAKENRVTRENALSTCLEPIVRAQGLGPEHPDVANSLHVLALGYTSIGELGVAEPLYQRTIAIWEKFYGQEGLELAQPLEDYAALLKKTGRETEAAAMETRAKAIRDRAEAVRNLEAPSMTAPAPTMDEWLNS